MTIQERIEQSLNEAVVLQKQILSQQIPQIYQISQIMIKTIKKGGGILVFGNGGSAADSQHFAAELVGRFKKERKAIKALALTTNASSITAIGNDYSFDLIFSRQIEALAGKKDLALGISTSGNSLNVIKGINKAKEMGLITVSLSGGQGGRLSKLTDISLVVHSNNTARIQESHILIIHILCQLIEEELFKN